MRTLLIALALYLSNSRLTSAEPKCHTVEAQSCLDNVFDYLNTLPKRKLPETEAEGQAFCSALSDTLLCWKKFKDDCMTPIQREMESLLLEGLRSVNDEICTPGTEMYKRYQENANCYNKVAVSDKTQDSIQYMLTVLQQLISSPGEQGMDFVCCAFNKVHGEIKQQAIDTCGAETVSAAEGVITAVISQLPKALCGGFDVESETCQKVKLPEGVRPSTSEKSSKIYEFVVEKLGHFLE